MAAAGQEVSSQTGRRGLGSASLSPGCGCGDIKVEQVSEGTGPGRGHVCLQSPWAAQPSGAHRGGGKRPGGGLSGPGSLHRDQPLIFPSPIIPLIATHQEFSPSVWKALLNSDTLSSQGAFPGPLTHSYKWPLQLKNSCLSWIVQVPSPP